MDINQEIEQLAEQMEKSTTSDTDAFEALKATISELGAEGLKKAFPTLSPEQQSTLKQVLETMKKSKQDLEPEVNSTPAGDEKQNSMKDFDHQDEQLDEEAKKRKQMEHRNQGGNPIEGWEGQVIGESPKQSEMPAKPSDVKLPDLMKKSEDSSREEAKEKIMQMEEKEHKTKNPKKLVEAEKKEHSEEKQEMKKADESAYGVDGDRMMKNEEQMESKEMSPEEAEKKMARKAMKKAKKKALKKALKKAAKIEAKGEAHWALKEKKRLAKKNLKKTMARMQERGLEKSACVDALSKSMEIGSEKIAVLWDLIEQKRLAKSESYKYDDGTVGKAPEEATEQSKVPKQMKDEEEGKVHDPDTVDTPSYQSKEAKKKASGEAKPLSGKPQTEADEGERPPQTMKKSDGFWHEEEVVYEGKQDVFKSNTFGKNTHFNVDSYIEASETAQKERLAKSKFDYETDEEQLEKAKKYPQAAASRKIEANMKEMKEHPSKYPGGQKQAVAIGISQARRGEGKLKKDQELPAEGPKEAEEQDKLPEILKKKEKKPLKKMYKSSIINDLVEKKLDFDVDAVEVGQTNMASAPQGASLVKSFTDAEMEELFKPQDMWAETTGKK